MAKTVVTGPGLPREPFLLAPPARHPQPLGASLSSLLTEAAAGGRSPGRRLHPPPSPGRPGPPRPLSLPGWRGAGRAGSGPGLGSAARRPRLSGRARLGSGLCGPPRGSGRGRNRRPPAGRGTPPGPGGGGRGVGRRGRGRGRKRHGRLAHGSATEG